MVKPYVPARGDIIWLDFNPQMGREQAKTRPALVISPKSYNKIASLSIVCPIRSVYRGWGFEVLLPNSLAINGSILADQIKSVDYNARNAKHICVCPENILEDVIAKIQTLI